MNLILFLSDEHFLSFLNHLAKIIGLCFIYQLYKIFFLIISKHPKLSFYLNICVFPFFSFNVIMISYMFWKTLLFKESLFPLVLLLFAQFGGAEIIIFYSCSFIIEYSLHFSKKTAPFSLLIWEMISCLFCW